MTGVVFRRSRQTMSTQNVHGQRSTVTPTLYVCNHVSYLDIELLGGLIPGSFVAKAEVATWPFFSTLAKAQRTIFVERRSSKTSTSRDEMMRRLNTGDNLMLFPEGTSSDGTPIWVSISGEPIFDAEGRFTGYRGIARNITQRKKAEGEADYRVHSWRRTRVDDAWAAGMSSTSARLTWAGAQATDSTAASPSPLLRP